MFNKNKFIVKKVIKKDDKEIVIGLDDENEFNRALALFANANLS